MNFKVNKTMLGLLVAAGLAAGSFGFTQIFNSGVVCALTQEEVESLRAELDSALGDFSLLEQALVEGVHSVEKFKNYVLGFQQHMISVESIIDGELGKPYISKEFFDKLIDCYFKNPETGNTEIKEVVDTGSVVGRLKQILKGFESLLSKGLLNNLLNKYNGDVQWNESLQRIISSFNGLSGWLKDTLYGRIPRALDAFKSRLPDEKYYDADVAFSELGKIAVGSEEVPENEEASREVVEFDEEEITQDGIDDVAGFDNFGEEEEKEEEEEAVFEIDDDRLGSSFVGLSDADKGRKIRVGLLKLTKDLADYMRKFVNRLYVEKGNILTPLEEVEIFEEGLKNVEQQLKRGVRNGAKFGNAIRRVKAGLMAYSGYVTRELNSNMRKIKGRFAKYKEVLDSIELLKRKFEKVKKQKDRKKIEEKILSKTKLIDSLEKILYGLYYKTMKLSILNDCFEEGLFRYLFTKEEKVKHIVGKDKSYYNDGALAVVFKKVSDKEFGKLISKPNFVNYVFSSIQSCQKNFYSVFNELEETFKVLVKHGRKLINVKEGIKENMETLSLKVKHIQSEGLLKKGKEGSVKNTRKKSVVKTPIEKSNTVLS